MTRSKHEAKAQNSRFEVEEEAQRAKMTEAAAAKPEARRGSKEPNAGGENREAGDHKGR